MRCAVSSTKCLNYFSCALLYLSARCNWSYFASICVTEPADPDYLGTTQAFPGVVYILCLRAWCTSKAVSSRSFLLVGASSNGPQPNPMDLTLSHRYLHGWLITEKLVHVTASCQSGCVSLLRLQRRIHYVRGHARTTSHGWIDFPLPPDHQTSVCRRETPQDNSLAQVASLIGLLLPCTYLSGLFEPLAWQPPSRAHQGLHDVAIDSHDRH